MVQTNVKAVELRDLWRRYKTSGDQKARDRLVPTGRTFVVVDTLGAGIDEMVLICQGSSARLTPETEKLPIDAVVIGLVDTVDVGGQVVFSSH